MGLVLPTLEAQELTIAALLIKKKALEVDLGMLPPCVVSKGWVWL